MKRLIKHVLIGLIIICVLGLYYIIGISCPIRKIFSVPCPTCGMGRSFFALMRLDFKQYLFYNPMTLPFLLAIFLVFHRKLFKKRKKIIDGIITFIVLTSLFVYLFRLSFSLIP